MTTNDDKREQAVPCKICATPTLMQGTKLCDHCYEIESRARLYPDDVERVLNYLGWRVKTPAALLREAEAATAPDVSEAERVPTTEEAIIEQRLIRLRKSEQDALAALRAARKREDEAVDALCRIVSERDFSAPEKMLHIAQAFLAARETAALNEGANNG